MSGLTPANQITLVRMLLIPAFVILVIYGHLGWALLVFAIAGLTDGLDGLIARWSGQKTSLGAWLDPMADKLLLVTTFVVLTLPQIELTNHVPLWLTILVISRDIVIVRWRSSGEWWKPGVTADMIGPASTRKSSVIAPSSAVIRLNTLQATVRASRLRPFSSSSVKTGTNAP